MSIDKRKSNGVQTDSIQASEVKPILDNDTLVYITPKEDIPLIKQTLKENYTFWERHFGKKPDSLKIYRKVTSLILPVLYSDPAVGFAFGATYQGYFRMNQDLRNQPSAIRLTGIYTIFNQYVFLSFWDLSMNKDLWRVRGQASYNHMPKKFFGIGPDLTDGDKVAEFINQDYVYVNSEANRNLGHHWYVGANIRYSYLIRGGVKEGSTEYFNGKTDDYLFDDTPGHDGFMVFGLGPKISRDTRDNIRMAYKGSFLELSSIFFTGNMPYINVTVDYRKYWKVGRKQYIGAAGYLNMNFGDVPYKEMPSFGTEYNDNLSIGRGYYAGRYMDKNLYYIQTEYRYPIWRSVRGVAFLGMGNVTEKMSKWHLSSLKYNYGGGLRIPFSKVNRIYLRTDLGFAPHEGCAFSLRLGEAF